MSEDKVSVDRRALLELLLRVESALKDIEQLKKAIKER